MSVTATIRIQEADFDVAQEIAALSKGRTDIGAVVSFSGICRGGDNGERDRRADARALSRAWRKPRSAAMPTRRCRAGRCRASPSFIAFGRIVPGENIVLVVTASSHRQAAFEAAEFLMDYLKTNAPFWKREESAERHQLGRSARP